MRYLSAITMLVLALAIIQPVAAQSFKPDVSAGIRATADGDFARALKHFKPLAEQGHAEAQFLLGQMYQFGWGVNKDIKQAIKWYRPAAKRGNSTAQTYLGSLYYSGNGVLQDLVMAYVWFNIAATNGEKKRKRAEVRAKLTASELKLGRKLSKLCFRKPAKCPEYSDD